MSISQTMSARCNAAAAADSRHKRLSGLNRPGKAKGRVRSILGRSMSLGELENWEISYFATAPAHPPTDPLPHASAVYTEGVSTRRCSTPPHEVDGDGRMARCSPQNQCQWSISKEHFDLAAIS